MKKTVEGVVRVMTEDHSKLLNFSQGACTDAMKLQETHGYQALKA